MTIAMKLEMDVMEEVDFPVQIKGRVRPFVRIQRSGGELGAGMPKVIIRDQSGKTVKHAVTKMDIIGDGVRMAYQFDLRIEQPQATEQLSITLEGRRMATVELPFALKNVPLP